MKNYNKFLSVFFLILSGIINAQVGIGNIVPNSSSILDITSTTQGILVPRMTTIQRNSNIASPAQGLLIYNTYESAFNYIQSASIPANLLDWKDSLYALKYNEQYVPLENTMTLTTDVLVPSIGFTATAQSANYLVQFSAEYAIIPEEVLTTAKSSFDSSLITLNNLGDGPSHNISLTNGNNGVSVGPGVYSYGTAIALAGELILNGNATDLFVFKITGALSSIATAKITLSGGALASNVFWICHATVDLKDSIMVGTLVASAATSITDCTFQGRILVNGAALSVVNSTISIPLVGGRLSPLGRIEDFALFSSAGAISNSGLSTITGDIGTANKAVISNFVTGTAGNTAVVNGEVHEGINIGTANFSVYNNESQIPSSLRTRTSDVNTTEISLQTIAKTVLKDELIEVKCNVKSGTLKLTNKKLSILKLR